MGKDALRAVPQIIDDDVIINVEPGRPHAQLIDLKANVEKQNAILEPMLSANDSRSSSPRL